MYYRARRARLTAGLPLLLQVAQQGNRFVGGVDTLRNLQVLRIGQREPGIQHARPGPIDETLPHPADQNQRDVLDVPHLQQLPDHQRLEDRADPARHDESALITVWRTIENTRKPLCQRCTEIVRFRSSRTSRVWANGAPWVAAA